MQALFEALAILFVLFLVLRVSLTRRPDAVRLRGGLVVLNLATGALAGAAVAVLLRAAWPAAPAAGADPAGAAAGSLAAGYAELGAALLRVLPVLGLLLGGLAGHLVFGALWRRFLRTGPASARTWLRRTQFLACLAAFVFLVHRLLA